MFIEVSVRDDFGVTNKALINTDKIVGVDQDCQGVVEITFGDFSLIVDDKYDDIKEILSNLDAIKIAKTLSNIL